MTIAKTMTDRDLKLTPPAQLTPAQREAWDAYYEPRNAAFRAAKLEGDDLVRWKYNRYMHDYMGCIKAVDESVGRVLDHLDEKGLAENTLVVYASDQGFYLGEHGWFDKRWIYEESLRTPMLARWPGVAAPGTATRSIASVLDLAPTFLAAAGVEPPADIQGKDLAPLLRGEEPADWRKSFYYEYYEYPDPHRVRPHYGVVTDRYKLVRFYVPDVDEWELFDLEKDPLEMRSVHADPAYAQVVDELKAELQRLRNELEVPDTTPREAFGSLYAPPRAPAAPKAQTPRKAG
jgi:arylsulfatase A-like enzyme